MADSLATELPIAHSKDPRLAHLNELSTQAGRSQRGQFIAEGAMLVERAIEDRTGMAWLAYSPELGKTEQGTRLLDSARKHGIACVPPSQGLLGKVTTSRPVPEVMAVIAANSARVEAIIGARCGPILIAENVNNPDNLGMILRTADAAGAKLTLVVGADPYHKSCVRAARGAVGRHPVGLCGDLPAYIERLKASGYCVVGAALDGECDLYESTLPPPAAIIVGNENSGITPAALSACTIRVRIPMSAGQDSLNVGVAAGVILYELLRRARQDPSSP